MIKGYRPFTFGRLYTLNYLKCLILGHSTRREPIIEVGGVVSTLWCIRCEVRFYPKDQRQDNG